MSGAKIDKLVHMANQIGDYFRIMPEPKNVDGAADHLRRFWTPKMIREIIAYREAGQSGLNATAASAIDALKSPKAS